MLPGIPIDIQRSAKRRSIAIHIHHDNRVIVKAPYSVSQKKLSHFIDEKSDWIYQKLAENNKKQSIYPSKTFQAGDVFYYLGDAYTLVTLKQSHPEPIRFSEGHAYVSLTEEEATEAPIDTVKHKLHQWYLKTAHDILLDRVHIHAEKMGKRPSQIRLKSLKSRWGSCSSHGSVNLNWTLIMAPLHVIDYVVIHELCHFSHMNHSPSFWALVASYCPKYKDDKKWLKTHARMLLFDY